jgi:NADPH-dependent 2,4-dienoyl-CoA reductase/sulfur reductase-like enzyme
VSNAAGTYDVAVVGGGPAGLAAAATAALGGCRVVLLDAAAELGGQFWRHRAGGGVDGPHRHGEVFAGLRSIVEERVDHVRSASVWLVEPGFALHTTAGRFDARRIVLATGAYDRVVPFPGWDLPGVVTPGAAQALLKGSGVLVGREVVVAGAGPFLLPVAAALAQAGARVVAVVEAGDPRRYLARRSGLPGVAAKLGEAAGYAAWLVRHRVPYHVRQVVTAAYGQGTVSSVDVAALDRNGDPGAARRLRCDAVAVGYGFTANVDLGLSLGCATRMSGDGGLAIATDAGGRTSVPGVFAAGEITGVGGAQLSVVEGELAGDAVAREVGTQAALSRRDVLALGRRAGRLRAFADAMHEVHAVPAGWASRLSEATIVCRCEEVPYGRIAHAVTDLGAIDARSVKLLARPGMGWCQGRVCGYATAAITADLCGRAVAHDDLVALAHRPFAAPVLLGDLADQWAQGAG